MRVRCGWFVAVACWTRLAVAQPQPPHSPVTIEDADPCVGDSPAIAELVELDISANEHPAGTAIVRLSCSGEQITIAVEDHVTRKRLERTIELAPGDPETRVRVVALAVVELVRASWLEIATPRVATVSTQSSAVAQTPRAWSAGVAPQLRSIGDFTTLGGGAFAIREHGHFALAADLGLEHARRTVANGDVTVWAATTAVRAGVVAEIAGIRAGLGGGVRGGMVEMKGAPRAALAGQLVGSTISAPWLAAIAVIELRTSGTISLGVAGEVGASLTSLRGRIPLAAPLAWAGATAALRASIEVNW